MTTKRTRLTVQEKINRITSQSITSLTGQIERAEKKLAEHTAKYTAEKIEPLRMQLAQRQEEIARLNK